LSSRLGVLGGTFNPIHYGHLAAAEEILTRLKLERVLIMPSFLPPHKREKDVPSAAHRLEMVRLATKGQPAMEPSEFELARGGRSYTVDTAEALQQAYPAARIHFIVGLDSFLELRTWRRWERLLTLCNFVVLSRPGSSFAGLSAMEFMQSAGGALEELDRGERAEAVVRTGRTDIYLERIPLCDVSSTDIRNRIKEGASVKYLLPESVEHYIIKNKLYA
jgi:nicotinate-nucleotide adenylyltransferase